mgnify:CR=1 FL=1
MLNKIILASQSKVRKEILDKNDIPNKVEPSSVDEDIVKESLLCLLYTSPSPRDKRQSRMPSSA